MQGTTHRTTFAGRASEARWRVVERAWRPVERWRTRVADALASDRGDVPGWVLITIMTAAVVAALWLIAEPKLSDMFETAIDTVEPKG